MPETESKQVRMPKEWHDRITRAAAADHGRSFNNVMNMFIERELPIYEKDLRARGLLPSEAD